MRSRPAYIDVSEAAGWISARLQEEGLSVPCKLVAKILRLETEFLLMVGLARSGDASSVQAGHIHRQAAWVIDPSAQAEASREVNSGERR